jgi:hypothetical protein
LGNLFFFSVCYQKVRKPIFPAKVIVIWVELELGSILIHLKIEALQISGSFLKGWQDP